jgi:outer membrane biosynthesis protein TonB
MKTLRLNPALSGFLLLIVMLAGCQHKKPVLVMPQQPPPTATPQATPTPAEAEAKPAEQQQPEAQPSPTPAEQPKTAEQTKPKHTRHAATKKSSGEKNEVAHNNSKRVIPPPSEPVPTPQPISPGTMPGDGGKNQMSTDQLLQGAETNLNGITRTLSKDEEAMRSQIIEFIRQSRTATTENDPARAHTLAVKARLLSDELVKQR